MRRLFCLAAAGLLFLSGTAAAASQPPPRDPDLPGRNPASPWHPFPGKPLQVKPAQVKPSGRLKALVLSFAYGERPVPVARHALLSCDPPRGTHPDPYGACEALIPVRGNPAELTPLPDVICTMQYDPVTVTATGVWDGRFIRFQQTYGNACSLYAATGVVFSF
ncbi:SSI family serine proteinase inhibitor [Streptosporangium sp. NPDC006007]|uniref:SSI family serine proteinase inhibitor n=1 Tax=Streptosporangium sp. NPDC006007 TaxID=3154575 RepID=UPI0033B0126B